MFVYKKRLKNILLVVLMMCSMQVLATAQDSFKQGAAFFKSADYVSAVKSFEHARKQGMKNTALYYNLGSAYYKSGNYKKSEAYFNVLKQSPKMQYLAEYNLGLIAEKLKKQSQAKKHYETVAKNSADKKLVYLANQKLLVKKTKKTGKSATGKKTARKKGSVFLSGTAGYDSNINFSPVDIGTAESGTFFDALVAADYIFSGNHANGWSAEAALYTIRYSDTANFNKGVFDQDQYGVSVKKTQRISSWDMHFKMGFDKLTYGAKDYQSILNIEAKARKKISRSDRVYVRYRYEDISSDDVTFDSLAGWRQKLRAEFRRYNKNNSAQLYYELELNNREDIPAGDAVKTVSLSPTRHTFRGKYTLKLNKLWQVAGDLSYRMSDYPSTSTQNRTDDRWRAGVNASYRFDKSMKLKLKYEYTDNASTESFYVYDRQLYSVNLSKIF